MRPVLDPWIEGYLDYQLKVRRLSARSIVDVRCTLRRAVLMLEQIRPGVLLWQADAWRITCSGSTGSGRPATRPSRLTRSCRICAGCWTTPGAAAGATATCWTGSTLEDSSRSAGAAAF